MNWLELEVGQVIRFKDCFEEYRGLVFIVIHTRSKGAITKATIRCQNPQLAKGSPRRLVLMADVEDLELV